MKIGILSDTHNNEGNLEKALFHLRRLEIDTLIHCGDLTDAETALKLVGFRVICAFGNGDYAPSEIRDALLRNDSQSFAGLVYTGKIDGVAVAVTHGHLSGKVEELARSGEYAYVFHGHSHQHEDILVGKTRVINPGALGGLKREPRQFCMLELESGLAEFVEV